MNKRLVVALLIAVFAFSGAAIVYAEKDDMGKMDKMGMMDKMNMDNKILKKAYFFLKNSEELGISDEQMVKIKVLKVGIEKELIQQNVDIEILDIDIQTAISMDNIDADAVNKLIGKKYDLKKAKAQYLVTKYVELKNILTAEQKTKLKDLLKQCKA